SGAIKIVRTLEAGRSTRRLSKPFEVYSRQAKGVVLGSVANRPNYHRKQISQYHRRRFIREGWSC
ncbi:MAG: hypothetical protein VW707_00625, partial [Candidatus Puniceispirillum sp.]